MRAISWQPLQTPRLNVSERRRKRRNWSRTAGRQSSDAAQPRADPSTSPKLKPPANTKPCSRFQSFQSGLHEHSDKSTLP